ncbi:MAG: glycosyltransferase [Acidobacteria bacterium]|nr:glycosyltransferase [Acidobacteriota bacterium]
MELVWQMAAALVLLEGIFSLWSGLQYLLFVRRELRAKPDGFAPAVSLLIPCKGLDPGFHENIRAFLSQDYDDYEVLFILRDQEDPAWGALRDIASRDARCRLVFSGPAVAQGQKVLSLIRGVQEVSSRSPVLAFADSDGRPSSSWLRALIDPLRDPGIGATTGYRWYVPGRGFWSALRSAWNGGVATLLGEHDRNFAWGGSMAIRKEVFQKARVLEYWQGALSDDYAMTRALKHSGYRIRFVPGAMVGCEGDCSLRELLEWSARQLTITKVYSYRLWTLAAISQGLFVGVWSTGVPLALWLDWQRENWIGIAAALAAIWLLACVKGFLRLKAMALIFSRQSEKIWKRWWGHTLLAPLVSLVTLHALLRSAFTNVVTWRGVTYRLVSPTETEVVRSDS